MGLGSPPLTRERRVTKDMRCVLAGITPAHAGKTTRIAQIIARKQDHPRSRGKDLPQYSIWLFRLGSPPLTRERRFSEFLLYFSIRITPAHAGKTSARLGATPQSQDHPRSRGKDIKARRCKSRPRGSPPLTRERRYGISASAGGNGITPAHAGKTFFLHACHQKIEDHPRSRGKDEIPFLLPMY